MIADQLAAMREGIEMEDELLEACKEALSELGFHLSGKHNSESTVRVMKILIAVIERAEKSGHREGAE